MGLNVEEFTGIRQVPARFDALFEHGALSSIFLKRSWFELLSDHGLDPGHPITIYAVSRADGSPLALLPTCTPNGGREVEGLTNFYSLAFAPLTSPDASASETEAAFSAIAARIRVKNCRLVHLKPMIAGAPELQALSTAFSNAGFAVRSYQQATNFYAETAGQTGVQFDDALSSRIKNTIDRKSEGLESRAFSLHTAAETIDEAVQAYQQVYAKSWKDAEPFPNFIPSLAAWAVENGTLRLGIWRIDSQPVAAQIWLVHQGRATIYKLAHDEQFSGQSVGSALTRSMFRAILDRDQPDIVDFGLGNEAYKKDWTPKRENRLGWLAFNKSTLQGRWQAAKHDLGALRRKNRTLA